MWVGAGFEVGLGDGFAGEGETAAQAASTEVTARSVQSLGKPTSGNLTLGKLTLGKRVVTMTVAPQRSNLRHIRNPIFTRPPVTRATLPLSSHRSSRLAQFTSAQLGQSACPIRIRHARGDPVHNRVRGCMAVLNAHAWVRGCVSALV